MINLSFWKRTYIINGPLAGSSPSRLREQWIQYVLGQCSA